MYIEVDLVQEATKIYEDQQAAHNTEMVRLLRGSAFDATKAYQSGRGGVTAEFLAELRRVTGNAGVLTLCLAFTALIGETRPEIRASWRRHINQHAFNPAFCYLGGPASFTRIERHERRGIIEHALEHAVDWLDEHATSTVHAIAYGLTLSLPIAEDDPVDQSCVNALTVGLSMLAAWRTNIIALPGSQVL